MASRHEDGRRSASRADKSSGRILVDDAGRRRPFMRGIMVHSLMARGVTFEEAFRTANEVRQRVRGRSLVPREEIANAVREILGNQPFDEERRFPLPPNITVTGRGKGLPFSKGVLSQSLLAAAIEPNDAFDVAREIEAELVRRGAPSVDRHELRELAWQALSRQMGERVAERYLVWRRFREPQRPVMILLGGTSGVGKTSLGLEVAHRLGIGRVLSTDSIRQVMRIMLSSDLVPALHGSSYEAHQLIPADSRGDDPVIEGFRAQVGTVSVGVRASMDRALSENASLVLDGVSLVPGLIDLGAYAERAHVIFLIVATVDEEALRERFAARAEHERGRAPRRYLENFDSIVAIQDYLLELADRYDVPIVDNVSFDRSVLLVIRHLTESLREIETIDAG
jgi:2-phosphoglycerate kinase